MQTRINVQRLPDGYARAATNVWSNRLTLSFGNRFLNKRVSLQDKAKFCLELSVMLQAGVSLNKSLQVLHLQTDSRSMKAVLRGLARDIQKGDSFSAALSRHPEVFDSLFVTSAEVGQESGKLPQVMSNLALYLEKISLLKRKSTQALAYPVLVLSIAVGVVSFLLFFIVPTFAEMFTASRMDLPVTTRIIFGLSAWMTGKSYFLVLVVVALGVLMRELLRAAGVRSKVAKYLYRIPFLGKLASKNLVARFCRTLATLLQAQVSLVRALEVTQRIMTNPEIRSEVGRIITFVKQGKTIAEPILASKLFPPMVSQMIAVGEETSELDAMLFKVAEYYEKEVDATVDSLSNVIEPILILVIGAIVASIVISMYLPMFDMMNVVGG